MLNQFPKLTTTPLRHMNPRSCSDQSPGVSDELHPGQHRHARGHTASAAEQRASNAERRKPESFIGGRFNVTRVNHHSVQFRTVISRDGGLVSTEKLIAVACLALLVVGIPHSCDAQIKFPGAGGGTRPGPVTPPPPPPTGGGGFPGTVTVCRTPEAQPGRCVHLDSCPPYLTLLQNPTTGAINYLRGAICDYRNNRPFLCCPTTGGGGGQVPLTPPVVTTTTTTTTTTTPPPPPPPTTPTLINGVFPSECGESQKFITSRIVGGYEAEKNSWPWIAVLGYSSSEGAPLEWLCGGSLINKRFVLTAAHCVIDRENELKVARLGDHNLTSTEDDFAAENYKILKITRHEQYNRRSFDNDIALLELDTDVQFSEEVHPVCLPILPPYLTRNLTLTTPFVGGWGTVEFNGPSSDVLRQVQIPVRSNAECSRIFTPFKNVKITDSKLCAGRLTGGQDACQGDSGGPLVIPGMAQDQRYYQIGVVSFGFRCAEPGFPGVYTRLTAFIDWMTDTIKKSASFG